MYQVFFLDFALFPGEGAFASRYTFRREEGGEALSGLSEVVIYELPKLAKRVRGILNGSFKKDLTDDEKWCIFMKYHHKEKAAGLIESLCEQEEGIMHAQMAVDWFSGDRLERLRQAQNMRDMMDLAEQNRDMVLKSRDEGISQGIAQNNLEIARKMKAMGISIAQITEATSLSPEAVERL